MGRRLAMLIATYEYQDSALRQLTAPAHDAEAFATVLRDPAIAGFEVTTLVNQPHHLVGEAIGDFYRDRRRDDLTLLYFTGHGLKDDDGRLYLAMANTRRDGLLFTALSAEQIDQAMEGCASRQKVLILDCCYSGAFPAGRISKGDTAVHALERFHGRGRTVLTASDATQYSFEGNQAHGQAVQSVFTRYLVQGLRDGSADLDGDGDITLDELYGYVHDRVVDEMPQQRPKKQDNVEGRIVIARNINWSLPAHLRHALSSPIATDRLGAVDGLAHLHRIGNDLVRRRAIDELQRLVDDDSRLVSAAAAARLQTIPPPAPEPPLGPAAEPGPTTTPATEPAVEVQARPSNTAPQPSQLQEPGRSGDDFWPHPLIRPTGPDLPAPIGLNPTTPARSMAASGTSPHTADHEPSAPGPTRRRRRRIAAAAALIAFMAVLGLGILGLPVLILALIAAVVLCAEDQRRMWLWVVSGAGLVTILIAVLVVSSSGPAGDHWWWSLVIAAGLVMLAVSELLRRRSR
ncbi:caspase family protein [Streptomyces sp. NPDC017056]|uniref:caspase, EACC1-associated type n=1 Tax=Streptomyces sp. NPDC017056 TaxID=3364973 RepID=UPI00379CF178